MPGSESKLLTGLEYGCDGIITATCNVTAQLAEGFMMIIFQVKIRIITKN